VAKAICTIVGSNYLPQATVFFDSVKQTNPDFELFCLVIDEGIALNSSRVKTVFPSQINIDQGTLAELRFKYDVIEFATAMKPHMLKFLALKEEFSEVIFFDPDILVFSKIEDHFFEQFSNRCAVLTPHRISGTEISRGVFYDIELLKTGFFNLGFISINTKHPQALNFLNWWIDRVNRFASRVGFLPFFTDQKWIDLAFHLFPLGSLSHPGYNVAPWNIDEREISIQNGVLHAQFRNLVFVHFSQMSQSIKAGKPLDYWGKASSLDLSQPVRLILENKIVRPYSSMLAEALKNSPTKLPKQGTNRSFKSRDSRNILLKTYLYRRYTLSSKPKPWKVILLSSFPIRILSKSEFLSLGLLAVRKDYMRLKNKLGLSKNLTVESIFLP